MNAITPGQIIPARQSATAVAHPVAIPLGSVWKAGERRIRLDRIHDSGNVEILDLNTLGHLMVRIEGKEGLSPPTLDWMRQAYKDGLLVPEEPVGPGTSRTNPLLLDQEACASADPKSPWRHRLASRAIDAGIRRTDADCQEWLDAEYGKVQGDFDFPKPSPSALRRWMTKLLAEGRQMSKLVLKTGRAKGQSQLDPQVSALVHEAALWYWTRRNGTIADAYALLDKWIRALNAERRGKDATALPHNTPSHETLRKRIARLRCYDTVKAKLGERAAKKMLRGSGEPMVVDTLLQVVLMDATMLEQVIVFDEDWKLPACKIRIVALMDAKSHAIVGWHIYAGPNRTETSLEAILNAMAPPDVPEEELAECPQLAWIFGKPLAILPDNELALIGPSVLPALEELAITVLEPGIEMPTAKASLERFWGTLKGITAQAPGTVIDPKIAKDMDYDAVGAASLTLPQLRYIVSQCVAWHNQADSRGLDGQTPAQVWARLADRRATPAFSDIAHARRVLGRTVEGLLTADGYERLGIRYRSGAVDSLLDNMSHIAALRSQRKDGSWTVKVKVRISPGNLDSVQIYDTVLEEWVELPSTQPEYTHLLSEWEHREFTKQAKLRNEAFSSQQQRLASRARTIALIDKMAPKMAFQQRRDMAALSQSLQVKRLGDAHAPVIAPPEGMVIAPQATFETGRADAGLPIKLPATGRRKVQRPEAPPRPDCYSEPPVDCDIDWDSVLIHGDGPVPADPEISAESEPLEDDSYDDSSAEFHSAQPEDENNG